MSYLKLIPEETILEIEARAPVENGLQDVNKKQRQEEFLAVFERCLSVKVSCDRVGITPHGYRYWKKTDAAFLRKLNHILEDWQTELVSASLTKAIGYVKKGEDGEIETDGYGTVIRYGSEPALAKYFMDAMGVGDSKDGKDGPVRVSVDIVALLGEDRAAKLVAEQNKTRGTELAVQPIRVINPLDED